MRGSGGDPSARRVRILRHKLVQFVKTAPDTAFVGSEAAHLDASGRIRRDARRRALAVSKKFDASSVEEWGDLTSRFVHALELEAPGIVVQLPPDEPRLAYAGSKQL